MNVAGGSADRPGIPGIQNTHLCLSAGMTCQPKDNKEKNMPFLQQCCKNKNCSRPYFYRIACVLGSNLAYIAAGKYGQTCMKSMVKE